MKMPFSWAKKWRHMAPFFLKLVMKSSRSRCFLGFGLVIAALLVGCQLSPHVAAGAGVPVKSIVSVATVNRFRIDAPMVWGGEVRCDAASVCRLVLVEHEEGKVALHEIKGGTSRILDRQPVAYHPDSAIWLSDSLVAAAVETSGSIDIFRVDGGRLSRVHQANVGFSPRDVIVVNAENGQFKLLATPYNGKEVAWVNWDEGSRQPSVSNKVRWCEAPWHPVRVGKIPGAQGGGVVAACLDDQKVVAVSDSDLMAPPRVLASFGAVARQARPSPSGNWLYVSLETGARNARINMQTGELQWIASPLTGSVAVAPLSDELVIWGEDGKLYIQRLDLEGKVQETRWLKSSGFSTGLQLIDLNGDGELDLVVLNSVDAAVDVIYGPLWSRAAERL